MYLRSGKLLIKELLALVRLVAKAVVISSRNRNTHKNDIKNNRLIIGERGTDGLF